MRQKGRRTDKSRTYVNLMNFKCANPNCEGGFNHEGHHIIPLSKGGVDAFWNLICLCHKCHRGLRLHSNYNDIDVELYTWKCMQELSRFGFNLDEKEPDFREKLKKAVVIAHTDTLHEEMSSFDQISLDTAKTS